MKNRKISAAALALLLEVSLAACGGAKPTVSTLESESGVLSRPDSSTVSKAISVAPASSDGAKSVSSTVSQSTSVVAPVSSDRKKTGAQSSVEFPEDSDAQPSETAGGGKSRAQSSAKPPEKTSSSGKQSEGANSITEEQAQKIAVKYVKATFRPTAPILAMGTGTETYNGETCYGFELREDNADHAAMLGIYLVGSRSRSLCEMDASTGGYQKVSP